jgi:phytoene synthase
MSRRQRTFEPDRSELYSDKSPLYRNFHAKRPSTGTFLRPKRVSEIPEPIPLEAEDRAFCEATLARGSRSFSAAARLLPEPMRLPFAAYYAFCRVSDDMLDEGERPALAHRELRTRVAMIYAGMPSEHPEDRALTWVASTYRVPREVVEGLLEGYLWDAQGRSYPDLASVLDYGARVAGSVGVALCLIMGRRDPHTLSRAADLGVAMQLTNIARDVGEDARAGRLYLPESWLREEGVDPAAFLADPQPTPAIRRCIARLLGVAEGIYRRADAGIVALPPECHQGIRAARAIYSAIGDEIAAAGHDSVSRRARTSAAKKLRLLAEAAFGQARLDPELLTLPPLPATRFLVVAAASTDTDQRR